MTRTNQLTPEFVDHVPEAMEPGKLYVSIRFNMAMHVCCCGCGGEVATRISPSAWKLFYNGRDVSLWPSIGPSTSECRSHYVVCNGAVHWLPRMSAAEVQHVRRKDAKTRAAFYRVPVQSAATAESRVPWWKGMLSRLLG
jgi:Family of unknown function (DUF6527)